MIHSYNSRWSYDIHDLINLKIYLKPHPARLCTNGVFHFAHSSLSSAQVFFWTWLLLSCCAVLVPSRLGCVLFAVRCPALALHAPFNDDKPRESFSYFC